MQIRFRALTSRFSTKEFLATVRDSSSSVSLGEMMSGIDDVPGRRNRARLLVGAVASAGLINGVSGLAGLVTGYANAPKDVESDEQVASADEVLALLDTGKLSPRDLVDAGEGWQTFAEHPLFCDLCDALVKRERRRSRVLWAAGAAGVAATLALLTLLAR